MIFPQKGVTASGDAVSGCINTVIPALFPYLVCSGYLAASGFATVLGRYLSPIMRPIFGLPGSGAVALVLGTISGYPVGAVCAADLYKSGECTKPQAERLMAFCNNSGPVFIMSVVGMGYLQSPYLGKILYISHVMSAVLTGVIMRTYSPSQNLGQKALPRTVETGGRNVFRVFGGVMDNSVFNILKICGFVIFFTVFAANLPKGSFSPYIHALLEITGGVRAVAVLDLDFETKLSLISFFIAFSGMSVLFQAGAIAVSAGLSLKPYFFGKLIQGIFSAILTKIMVSGIPQRTAVFAPSGQILESFTAGDSLCTALFMLGIGLIILIFGGAIAKGLLKINGHLHN